MKFWMEFTLRNVSSLSFNLSMLVETEHSKNGVAFFCYVIQVAVEEVRKNIISTSEMEQYWTMSRDHFHKPVDGRKYGNLCLMICIDAL